MKKRNWLIIIVCFICITAFLFLFINKKESNNFSLWNEEGVINELIKYVEDVTNPKSENYIPEEDRIAVFDLDGTLLCEQAPIYSEWMMYAQRVLDDPNYNATQEMKDVANEILNAAINKMIPENTEEDESYYFGIAFDGMLTDDYKEYIGNFLNQEVDGFDNMTYKDSYYRPMVEVLKYLDEHDFVIYVVSGTDRDFDRIVMDYIYHIPYYQVIGSDCYNEGNHHDDVDYLQYQYDKDEEVMRDSTRIIKNVKASKVMQMYQEIGQKPVLAFGNSSGDQSMFTFTSTNEKYKTAVFCIVPDDNEREYASQSKTEKLTKICLENNYHVVSMKDDFLTIYGEGVNKNPNNMKLTYRLLDIYKNKQ